MRHFLSILPIAVSICAIATAQDKVAETLTPIDDSKIEKAFEKDLTILMEDGATTDVKALLEGLKSSKTSAKLSALPQSHPILTDAELYQKARKATLAFGRVYQCDRCDKWHGSIAGAVVIDPSGIAVTNYHVMDNSDSGAFGGMNSEGKVFAVKEILAASKKDDLAIVQLEKGEDGADFDYAPLSSGDPVGTELRVISHPDGRYYTLSEGVIARYFVDPKTKTSRVQITADYARGSSGSGVFNMKGELIGVVAATSSIYYTQNRGVKENLQMVVKSCIPVTSVSALFEK